MTYHDLAKRYAPQTFGAHLVEVGVDAGGCRAALMEEMTIDKRFGFFVNHDLAPTRFRSDHVPMKAKGVGELGIVGAAAAIASAIYNATGVRVRDYSIALDKYSVRLPVLA